MKSTTVRSHYITLKLHIDCLIDVVRLKANYITSRQALQKNLALLSCLFQRCRIISDCRLPTHLKLFTPLSIQYSTTSKMASKSVDLTQPITNAITNIYDYTKHLSVTSHLLLLVAFAASLYFIKAATKNYNLYVSLGPGGVSYGVRGWLFNWLIRPVASTDLCSVEMYDDPKARSTLR